MANTLPLSNRPLLRHLLLAAGSLALVAVAPINTNTSPGHVLAMGIPLILAVALPYLISHYLYYDNIITFPFRHGRRWYRSEVMYIFFTAAVAYFVLPFYFANTGAYHNWTVMPGTANLIALFIGTQALGLWDELYFVNTLLTLLRRHLRFVWANLIQAGFWTIFLYQLGFRGWAPFLIYPFALLQGYIFKRTGSLLYIITIHLTLDLVLYLALLHAYHPGWVPIFLT
jgi:membrane protease YdiL (CAAX protease family)